MAKNEPKEQSTPAVPPPEPTITIDVEKLRAIPFGVRVCMARLSIGYIEKRGRNDFHKYDYATAGDVQGICGRQLAALGILVTKNPEAEKLSWSERPTKNGGKERVCEIDGVWALRDAFSEEKIEAPIHGEGADSADKAYYKAATGAMKYFLIHALELGIGDDPEASGDEERGDSPQRGNNRVDRSTAQPEPPADISWKSAAGITGSTSADITADRASELAKLAEEAKVDIARLVGFFKVEGIDKLPYEAAKKKLVATIEKNKQAETAAAPAAPKPMREPGDEPDYDAGVTGGLPTP